MRPRPHRHARVALLALPSLLMGGAALVLVPSGAPAQRARATGPTRARVPSQVCRSAAGCEVLERHDAGTDAQGRALEVVKTAPRGAGPEAVAAAQAELGCVPYAYWLLVERGGRVLEHRRLIDVCNDGYGAAGIGDDELTIGPNRVEHQRLGGSAWRWGHGTVLQLSPFRVLSTSEGGYWSIGPHFGEASWDWSTRSGHGSWFSPWCDDGDPIGDGDPDRSAAAARAFRFDFVPEVTTPAGFVEQGWRTEDLEGCSSSFDGSVDRGHLLAGTAAPADARFRALVTGGRTLVVEIEDDRLTPARRAGLAGDVLQVWLGPSEDYMSHCLEHAPLAAPWTIAALDGRVLSGPTGSAARPGNAAPVRPRVERATLQRDGRTVVRLRVVFPERLDGLTVGYADSDDGRTRERLIATSALGADVASLGRTWSMGEGVATCERRGGVLQLVQGARITDEILNAE